MRVITQYLGLWHVILTIYELRRCTWSSGWYQLVTFRLWFNSHCGSFASNLKQVANLLCAQVNSTSYPQRDGKWVVAYALRGEDSVSDWGGGMPASCNRWRGQWMAA